MMGNSIDETQANILTLIQYFQDTQSYSDFMKNLFTKGIYEAAKFINSFNLFKAKSISELQNNFKKNVYKIVNFIKNDIKPSLDLYNVLSCIFGAFLGDAMGAFCEFEKPNLKLSKRIFNYPSTVIGGLKGQVTDDSEMALSLAYAIMDTPKKEELSADYIYFYYGAWFKTSPLDYGATTKKALKQFDFVRFHPLLNNFKNIEKKIEIDNKDSLSNGFLMRKSPFIVWLYYRFYHEISEAFSTIDYNKNLLNLYLKIRKLSAEDNKCTNPNDEVNTASSIYCLMSLMAIKGLTASIIINKILNLCQASDFINCGKNEENISGFIQSYIEYFKNLNFNFYNTFLDLKNQENVYNHMGYYKHALKLILYFLCQFEYIETNHPEKKYREIMNQICNIGGDTDTNCCIVGAVIGPLIGMKYFGKELNTMIELIPPGREIYSVALIVLFVIYLKKSNRDSNLIQNDKYFSQQILTMLYGDIDLSY